MRYLLDTNNRSAAIEAAAIRAQLVDLHLEDWQ